MIDLNGNSEVKEVNSTATYFHSAVNSMEGYRLWYEFSGSMLYAEDTVAIAMPDDDIGGEEVVRME